MAQVESSFANVTGPSAKVQTAPIQVVRSKVQPLQRGQALRPGLGKIF